MSENGTNIDCTHAGSDLSSDGLTPVYVIFFSSTITITFVSLCSPIATMSEELTSFSATVTFFRYHPSKLSSSKNLPWQRLYIISPLSFASCCHTWWCYTWRRRVLWAGYRGEPVVALAPWKNIYYSDRQPSITCLSIDPFLICSRITLEIPCFWRVHCLQIQSGCCQVGSCSYCSYCCWTWLSSSKGGSRRNEWRDISRWRRTLSCRRTL